MSKDKMTTTPWVAGGSFPYKGNEGYIFSVVTRPEILVCKTFGSIDENTPPISEQMENSKAIVAAVNSTYGQNIAPEAVKELLGVLTKIANWELPETGKFWDGDKKEPLSYQAAYGSEGVREYFQKIAKSVIEKATIK